MIERKKGAVLNSKQDGTENFSRGLSEGKWQTGKVDIVDNTASVFKTETCE